MAFQVTTHHGPFLRMIATGEAQMCDLLGGIELTRVVAVESGYRRALLDLLGVEQQLSYSDHMRLGVALGTSLTFLDRVAAVVPAEFRVGTGEAAAQLTGMAIRTFMDLPSAVAWLNEGA